MSQNDATERRYTKSHVPRHLLRGHENVLATLLETRHCPLLGRIVLQEAALFGPVLGVACRTRVPLHAQHIGGRWPNIGAKEIVQFDQPMLHTMAAGRNQFLWHGFAVEPRHWIDGIKLIVRIRVVVCLLNVPPV